MAHRRVTPTVKLRRLANELAALRGEAGLSRDQVSRETGINDVGIYRIETAQSRPQARTLIALMNVYGVDDEKRAYLTGLREQALNYGWHRPFHDRLPEQYAAYISFEDEAKAVRNYGAMFVPGLLQTEVYARAVVVGSQPSTTDSELDDRVQARLQRRAVLDKETPLHLWAVVDEVALRRVVGSHEVMAEQLDHLVSRGMDPNVTVQVVPFDAGAHPGLRGAFVIMEFPDPADTDLIYVETVTGDQFLEKDEEVERFRGAFDNLVAVALSPKNSAKLIADIARQFKETM